MSCAFTRTDGPAGPARSGPPAAAGAGRGGRRNASLSSKVAGLLLAVIVGLAAVLGALTFLYEHRLALHDQASREDSLLAAYAAVFVQPLWNLDDQQTTAMLRSLLTFPDVACAEVRSGDRRTWLTPHGPCRRPDRDEGALTWRSLPILHEARPIGQIEVAFARPPLPDLMAGSFSRNLAVGLLILAAMYLTVRIALKAIVIQPVQRLTADMLALAGGRLDAAPAGRQRRDEIGEMARALETFREAMVANRALQATLVQTEREMAAREKMASLGNLVAGITHEVGTPLGVALTAATTLDEQVKAVRRRYAAGELTEEEFNHFLDEAGHISTLVETNLGRAAMLIRSFKRIAVDQSKEEEQDIELASYIADILASLKPTLRKHGHQIRIEADGPLRMRLNPAALWQIISNLVMNAVVHAYDEGQQGTMTIRLGQDAAIVWLIFEDDGKGMAEEIRRHVFDPFFTTRRGRGGSGLGLSIVYNLVTHSLRGSIQCDSAPGLGAVFRIGLPGVPVPGPVAAPTAPDGGDGAAEHAPPSPSRGESGSGPAPAATLSSPDPRANHSETVS